jgi:NAD(P)-dependent dehydrogenase (short-subunit alcohol dehydrogenase family)
MPILERFRLDGRVAVITGASSGLGVVFARALAEAGCDIAVGARRRELLADTVQMIESLGRRAVAVRTDVANPADCTALVDAAVAELGRVDVLVNNAAIDVMAPALRLGQEDFERVIDVNLNGCFWMAQAAARVMGEGGSIINVASVIGLRSSGAPQAPYAASKAAVMGLTRDLADQWTSRRGIRVNALVPGFVATELTAEYADSIDTLMQRVPCRRTAEPEEIAAGVVFLASPASSYMTGQNLVLDGGFTIA